MYKRITSSWQNRHLRFLAISQFLYEVIMMSSLPKNSTLYIDMDFCISLGMGWSRILCYTYIYMSLFNLILIYALKVIHMFYYYLFPNGSTIYCYEIIFMLSLYDVDITDCVLCWFLWPWVFSCLRLRQWPVTYLITLSDWITSCQPGRHAVVTVCEPDWKHKWAAYKSFDETSSFNNL